MRKILLMESAEAVATVKATSAKSTVKAATVTGEMLICAIAAETAAFAVTAVEHISEDITKNIVHIFTVKMKFLIAAIAATLESAESTGAMAGLGMRIRSLNNSFESAPMLLYIIIIGILGITIEKLIKTAERRLTSWQEKREI